MTLQLLRHASMAVALMGTAVLGCAGGGDETTGVGGVLVVSRVDVEGGNRVVLIGGTYQLQATPRTSTGIAVPGRTVTWSSANTAIAQVSSTGLMTGVAAGMVSITAVVEGITGRIEMDVRQVPVATVQVLASVTTLEAGQTTQLQAVTLDSTGGMLLGRATVWSSSNPAAATVSPQGLVTAVGAGSAILTATSEGRSGSVTFTVTPRPASRLGFVTQPSNATAGMAITPAIRVALQDEVGNTVTNATGTITLTFASSAGGATLTGSLSVQSVQGVAVFPDVRVNRAGQGYTLRATAQGFAEAVSGTFNVSAGPPASLAVVVEPAGGSAAGAAFSQQPVVQLRDAQGNDVRQAGVTVTAVLASGPGTLNGTTSTVTGSDGRAVFTNLAIVGSVGSYSLQFTAAGLTPATSSPFGLGAGLATQLTFTTAPPGTAVNGQPLGTTVVVQLRDATGNPVAQAGTLVTAAIQSGTGSLGGTLVVATGSTGAAEFPGLVITGIVGSFTLRFSAPGVTPAISNTIALQPGAATQLTFTTAPGAAATNGVNLPSTIVVQLRDVGGNVVPSAGVNVAAAIQSGPGGVLSGTTSVLTGATGSATFSTLRITGLVGAYTLRFSAAGVSPATSTPITLAPGAATALAIQVQPPASATSGVVLSPQPSVRIVDQSGNTVSSSTLNVTAGLASGPGTLGGILTVGAASGVAAFTNLTLSGSTGTYTIGFTAPGVTGVTSGTIGVGSGAIAGLAFVGTPPASGANGAVLSPAIAVRLMDGSANPVLQSGVSVSATLASGPGGLSGTLTVTTDASGVATFSNLVLTGLVGNYTIQFSVSGATPLTTNPIALGVGAATKLLFDQAPPTTATNGQSFASSTIVRLADAGGNLVPTDGVSVLAAIASGPGAVLSGTVTKSTVGGFATFDNLILTGTVGTYTLDFTSGSLTRATSGGIQLQAGNATKLAFTTSPPASAQSGTALSPAPVVQLQDVSNNNVAQAGVTVSVSRVSGDPSVVISGGVAVTDASGRAVFNALTLTGPADSYVIAFLSAGLTGVTSSSITLTQPPPTTPGTIAANSATSQSATVGTAVAEAPSVLVTGAGGVPVSGVSVTFTVTSGGGAISPASPATVPTNASGIATLSSWTLGATAGSNTVTATAAGLAGSPVTFTATGTAVSATTIAANSATSQSATVGTAVAAAPSVLVTGAGGVPISGVSVIFTVTSGGGSIIGSATITTNSLGVATVGGWVLGTTAAPNSLSASSAGLAGSPVTFNAMGTAAAAAALEIATQPAGAEEDERFTTQPVLRVVDTYGNVVTTSTANVTAKIESGSGALKGTTTIKAIDGVASFTNLKIDGTGPHRLRFTSPGLTSAVSASFTVVPD
ncbi:MAG: beta strand repeat-containing protein [Gemmatimonadales bacterium]